MSTSSEEVRDRQIARLHREQLRERRVRLLMTLIFPLGGALLAAGVAYLLGERSTLNLAITATVTFLVSCLTGTMLLRSTYRRDED